MISAAGVAGRAAARTGARAEFDAGADTEPIAQKIDLHRLGFVVEILVHDELETVYFIHIIIFLWLIQSHGQRGAASSPLV